MRSPSRSACLAILLLAGCAAPAVPPSPSPQPLACAQTPLLPRSLYLADGMSLRNATGPAGSVPAGDTAQSAAGSVPSWQSAPITTPMHLEGNVTFRIFLAYTGTTPTSPRSGPDFAFWFGSTRALASGLAATSEHAVVETNAGEPLTATLPLPAGGYDLEPGDAFRLVMASLVEGANPSGSGAAVLYGEGHPSEVRFAARCFDPHGWLLKRDLAFPVILPGSQGGLAHAPAQEGLNRQSETFDLEAGTARLGIQLRQSGTPPVRSDMDVRLFTDTGKTLYEATSPFANETMVLWPENLAALAPPGHYRVQVDAYSGGSYTGKLTIVMEEDDRASD